MMQNPAYNAPEFDSELFKSSPDALSAAVTGGRLPQGFYSATPFPTYVKVRGEWLLVENSSDGACIAVNGGKASAKLVSEIRDGDEIVTVRSDDGSNGVFVNANAFSFESDDSEEDFRSGYFRETSQTKDYEQLYDVLRFDRDSGFTVFAVGAACAYDYDSRKAMANLIKAGYCDAVVAGSELAVNDLEASRFNTCRGRDIYTKRYVKNGNYNRLETVQKLITAGSVEKLVEEENLRDGIISAAVRENTELVLTGSPLDDCPLPGVVTDAFETRRRLALFAAKATTVVCLATQSLSAALSKLTPTYSVKDGAVRPVHFFCVDISEYPIAKLGARGRNGMRGIVTNIQDCLVNLERNLI